MGIFDTYELAWGDGLEGVQTKQFDPSMVWWRIGARVPLGDLSSDSEYGWRAPAACVEPVAKLFFSIAEEHALGHSRPSPLVERVFVLGHRQGLFADYGAFWSQRQADAQASRLDALWTLSPWAEGLARMLGLIIERNARAELSLAQGLASIDPMYAAWRRDISKKRGDAPTADGAGARTLFEFAYHGPDFTRVSRSQARAALARLSAHWRESYCDFDAPIGLAMAQGRAEEAAERCDGGMGHGLRIARGPMGSPGIWELAERSEPVVLDGPPSHERAMSLLARGQWRLFELDARELADDPAFASAARAAIAELSVSRLGSFWAAGVCARAPELAPESIPLDGEDIPWIEWLGVHMGLPSRLLEPLLDGRPGSAALLHQSLLPHHASLFEKALDACGTPSLAPDFQGCPFLVQAARHSRLDALMLATGDPRFDPRSPSAAAALREALDAERAAAASVVFGASGKELDVSVACAAFLIGRGVDPGGHPCSDRVLAKVAQAERETLDDLVKARGGAPDVAPPRL